MTNIITRITALLHPLRHQLNHAWANAPIRLRKHRLKHMHINAIIPPGRLGIPFSQAIAVRLVVRVGLELHEHHVDLLPRAKDDSCCRDLGFDSGLSIGETLVEAALVPRGVGFLVAFGLGEGLRMLEEFLHPEVVAGTAGGGVEEEFETDEVGGPDHGLDTEVS